MSANNIQVYIGAHMVLLVLKFSWIFVYFSFIIEVWLYFLATQVYICTNLDACVYIVTCMYVRRSVCFLSMISFY